MQIAFKNLNIWLEFEFKFKTLLTNNELECCQM